MASNKPDSDVPISEVSKPDNSPGEFSPWISSNAISAGDSLPNLEQVAHSVSNVSDDVASSLGSVSAHLPSSLLNDESLSLSMGALSIVNPSVAAESETKKCDASLSLADAVNTSDDIKCTGGCFSRSSSVPRGVGAISKKSTNTIPHKISKCGKTDKSLKVCAKGPGPSDTDCVSDEAVSPLASAPPPPPPTPNVLGNDAAQDTEFPPAVCLLRLPVYSMTPNSSESLKKSSSTLNTSTQCIPPFKDGIKSSNLISLLSTATGDHEVPSFDTSTRSSIVGNNTNQSTSDTCSANVGCPPNMAAVKPLPAVSIPGRTSNAIGIQGSFPHVPAIPQHASYPNTATVHPVVSSAAMASHYSGGSLPSGSGVSLPAVPAVSHSSGSLGAAALSLASSFQPPSLGSGSNSTNEGSPARAGIVDVPLPAVEVGEGQQQVQQRALVHNAKAGPMYNWQATLTTVKERSVYMFL